MDTFDEVGFLLLDCSCPAGEEFFWDHIDAAADGDLCPRCMWYTY
jgi:hypothetical protein